MKGVCERDPGSGGRVRELWWHVSDDGDDSSHWTTRKTLKLPFTGRSSKFGTVPGTRRFF